MALLPLHHPADIHLVMAQQSIGNVESQVGQSVVDSTTDVDVSKTISSATSGGAPEENRTETSTRDLGTRKVGGEGTESRGNANSEKTIDESRTQTLGMGGDSVDSDIDGSGVGFPTKSIGVEGVAKVATRTSVKKPQSFKAVSINKHFLEKASAGTNSAPTKTVFGSDRLSSLVPQTTASSQATLSFAKPRLVAKSSSGIRDSSPGGMTSSTLVGAKNAAEAQRAVWNKNQPPPVVPSKEMTDEELKKTYGIHLASRLQTEDVGKESTWADEDDDEDWVPETIEWNDGTKAVLLEPAIPAPPAAVPESTTSVPPTQKAPEGESSQRVPEKPNEPKTLVFTRDSSKLIDKVDKGAKDASTPRASPWATLPPPNTVPLPAPRSESRASDFGGSQNNVGSREVHADDFNRSWRDRPMSNQLYNSQTGQLEPVHDRNRVLRNSRAEMQLGKTQVLQRPPSQLSGPAEPSPAFQQTRTGAYRQDEYKRRRTSSNVSGGSGSTGRRLSFNKGIYGPEHPLNPEDSANSPRHFFSGVPLIPPELQSAYVGNGPSTPLSAAMAINTETGAYIVPSEDFEDPIAKQQRIMKEARELARKRKQEEEAREEAARKERLRLKLEALQKEADAKAARAAEEAEKAAESAEAEAAKLPPMSTAEAGPIATGLNDSRQCQNSSDPGHPTPAISLPNVTHHNPQLLPTTQVAFNTSTVLNQPSLQGPSLASIPYRPGSFGNRSPTKKFSTLQSSSQSPTSSNTYNIPIRDPRYDPTLNGRFSNESFRWTEKPNPRASPYGSIGDKSKYTASNGTKNSTFAHQQYSSQSNIAPKPQEPQDVMPTTPVSLVNSEHSPEEGSKTPTTIKETPVQVDKPILLATKVDSRQAMTRNGRQNVHPPHMATTVEKPFHPWASYPEQLRREEDSERRIAREQNRAIAGSQVANENVTEHWTHRSTDAEESHQATVHTNTISTGSVSEQDPSRFSNSINSPINDQGSISKPPSSPPPAEFCPVTALEMNSDEDSQKGQTRAQPRKPVPFVRLPPPPSRAIGTSAASTLDGHNRQDRPISPNVNRYDRVLGTILKTIEVSKGHQSSPTTASAAPPKFSETKSVYTDDREAQQQSLTTVSLPPQIDHVTAIAEPEDICTNDEENFLQRLYVQEFGSQPTVKIPVILQNSAFSPARSSNSKSKRSTRPKGFAESVPLFEIVGADDLVNEQGHQFIPVRIGPDSEMKKVVIQNGWPKPMRREPRKNAGYNNNNNNRKSGANNGYFKKDAKPFMNQRQRMQSPNAPKPIQLHWERQHPVV